jgi:glutathione S-transferase
VAIILYDLAGADEKRRFSPYCWRIHMALKHKGLPFDTKPWRFTEKDAIAFANSTTVPVIVDGDRPVADSWKIAEYLDAQYPDRPALIHGDAELHLTRFARHWAEGVLSPLLLRMLVKDINQRLTPKDQEYFRSSREKRLGQSLEAYTAGRDQAREQFRQALTPLRRILAEQPFLCGDAPAFADYVVFGPFQWARGTSPYFLLAEDDPVFAWRERMLSLHDGYARSFPAG